MAKPPVLTLSDVSLTFGGNPLFSGLEMTLHAGDRICLVGRNGSGKSTLLKIISGLVEPDSGSRFLTPGLSVGYLDQDPDFAGYSTLKDYALGDLDSSQSYLVDMAAEGLKLNLEMPPEQASGGERRRAALARIIARAPDLMLLDEPTNHLDIQAIAWLESHLRQTKNAYVLISHDRAFLRNLTNATLWVDRGIVRRQEKGFEAFETWRDETYTQEEQSRHKLSRLIKSEGRWAVEGISARRKRNQGRVRRLAALRQERASQIARTGTARMEFDSGPKSGKLVVEAKGISKSYDGRTLFDDFSIRVMRGECIALVGPNGVGKTTLLKVLTGTLLPDTGTIKLGTNLVPALFDQNREELDPNVSLWDSLTEDKALGISGRNDQILVRGQPKHVVGYLKEFLFDEGQARGPVSALSGGEKARLLLARIMARESNLLILDEPTNDLDVETLDLLQELLDGYEGTVILVSHDRDFLDRVATSTIAMDGDGSATLYAGGWSDYRAQLGETAPPTPKTKTRGKSKPAEKRDVSPGNPAPGREKMTFKQEHRLKELPGIIERLENEIKRLEDFLSDPELFSKEPEKFSKASDGLVARHEMLSQAEEEWMDLAALAESLA